MLGGRKCLSTFKVRSFATKPSGYDMRAHMNKLYDDLDAYCVPPKPQNATN